jgi:hypothetical protein
MTNIYYEYMHSEYMHYEYAFVIMLIIYLIAMATLKIKYGFWHNQPLSFRYSPYWWWHRLAPSSRPDSDAAGSSSSYLLTTQYNLSNTFTSISSGTTKAVIFPFIHNVNYLVVMVFVVKTSPVNSSVPCPGG